MTGDSSRLPLQAEGKRMHWGIGQGQPDSKPEMGLLVTRSYRKRRNDQPEDNSRDTAKDPLARMGSLAGLVVHGRRSSVERIPHGDPRSFSSFRAVQSHSQSAPQRQSFLPKRLECSRIYVAWQAKIWKAHAMPLCGWSHFWFHGVSLSRREFGAAWRRGRSARSSSI
jgi:hypothetical protein